MNIKKKESRIKLKFLKKEIDVLIRIENSDRSVVKKYFDQILPFSQISEKYSLFILSFQKVNELQIQR